LREITEVGELIASGEPARDTELYCEDRAQDNSTGQYDLPGTNNSVHSSNEHLDDSLRLYEQSSLSTEESHVLVNSYMCRHNLTGQAREDLLQLLQLHLPSTNHLSPSLYTFNKYTDHTRDIEPDYHYYCSVCYSLLPSSDTTHCPNTSCNNTIKKDDMNFFITVSVATQLKNLLESKH